MTQSCLTRRETYAWCLWQLRMLLVFCWLAGCGHNPVDELARQLQDQDVGVRRHAAAALVEMGRDAKPAISALSGALDDEDREVRRMASRALGHLGPEAASCLTLLCKSLDDDELSVRLAAAFAIQELDPAEKSHTTVLIEAMKMGEGGTIVAVGRYRENAVWAVPTLVSLLEDRRAGIRRIAAEALRQIGTAAGAAEDALRQAANEDVDDRVREAAKEALVAVKATTAS